VNVNVTSLKSRWKVFSYDSEQVWIGEEQFPIYIAHNGEPLLHRPVLGS